MASSVGDAGRVARAISLAVLLAGPLSAQPGTTSALDQEGTTLPKGAIARLGSARFRHGAGIRALAYAPDGETVASLCQFGVLNVWDSCTGELRHQSRHKLERPAALAFRKGGTEIVLCGAGACRRI